MLGREIAALRFDVKPFFRELALTKVYRASIDLPGELTPLPSTFAADLAALKSRTETIEADVERAEKAYQEAEKAWHKAEAALIPLAAEEEKAVTAHAAASKKEGEAKAALAAAEKAVADRRETAKVLVDASAKAEEVVKKLPKEKELADAARVFANRAKAVANEVTALEKASVEKGAAFKKTGEERAAVAKTIVAAREKMRPVRESVRREEAATLEARRKQTEARVSTREPEAADLCHGDLRPLASDPGTDQHSASRSRGPGTGPGRRLEARSTNRRTSSGPARPRSRSPRPIGRRPRRTSRNRRGARASEEGRGGRRGGTRRDSVRQALLPGDDALGKAAGTLDGRAKELKASLGGFEEKLAKAESARNKAADATKAVRRPSMPDAPSGIVVRRKLSRRGRRSPPRRPAPRPSSPSWPRRPKTSPESWGVGSRWHSSSR